MTISLLLHLVVVALLILRVVSRGEPVPTMPEPTEPADYAVVFQSQQGPSSVPDSTKPGPPKAPPSAPLSLATPQAPPSPDTPASPPPRPVPAPAQPPTPVQPPTPPAAKPSQAPPPPPTTESSEAARPPPAPAQPRQAPRPPAPPHPKSDSDFPAPTQFSLGPQPRSRPTEQPGRSTQKQFGPEFASNAPVDSSKSGPSYLYDYKQISGPRLRGDWFDRLLSYWLQHRFYPQEAIANQESGTALVRIKVSKYGHVDDVELEGRSGSRSLDLAAQSWIRDGQLDPFPPGTDGDEAVIDVRIQYQIIYGR